MIKRLVVWGGRENLDSIRHIMRSYHMNALKLGIDSVWVKDEPGSYEPVAGDTVLSVDVCGRHLPHRPGVDYVLHNFSGTDDICRRLEDTPERLLRLQVWTYDAQGEKWSDFRQFDREARTLFQPWGTDLLPEEFMDPVFNPDSLYVTFVGAIWRDQYKGEELGNEFKILELQAAVRDNNLVFDHYTQVETNVMVIALRDARLTPAFVGDWQAKKGYVPCRVLKNPSYGCLSITNIPEWPLLLGQQPDGVTVAEIVRNALKLSELDYKAMVRVQQRHVRPYNYRENLAAIEQALEEGR